jgi:hypothetical protein
MWVGSVELEGGTLPTRQLQLALHPQPPRTCPWIAGLGLMATSDTLKTCCSCERVGRKTEVRDEMRERASLVTTQRRLGPRARSPGKYTPPRQPCAPPIHLRFFYISIQFHQAPHTPPWHQHSTRPPQIRGQGSHRLRVAVLEVKFIVFKAPGRASAREEDHGCPHQVGCVDRPHFCAATLVTLLMRLGRSKHVAE